jgi:tetratricopeptide (TPR) repeat protein
LDEAREQALTALAENLEAHDVRGVQICERFLAHLSGEELGSGRREFARDVLNRAQAVRRAGRAGEAQQFLAEALRLAREEEDEVTEAKVLGALGITSFKGGAFAEAAESLAKAVELHTRHRSAYTGECASYLARSYSHLGRHEDARRVMGEALQYARDEQDEISEARALGALGLMNFNRGDFAAAVENLERAVGLHSRGGSDYVGECSRYLALSHKRLGRRDAGRRVIETALAGNLKPEERAKLKKLLPDFLAMS